MEAATALGYRWPTLCHGQARCTICAVELVDGLENVQPAGPVEAPVLERLLRLPIPMGPRRLACQLRLTGDVRVRKNGVERVRDEVR
jgi:ferredoxin, 2Fe-2S